MPTHEILERFVARVESNEHDKAIAEFYADDASMQENQEEPRKGRDKLIAREQTVLRVVSLVKQLKVPQTTFVHLFHSVQVPLNEVCPFDRLDDRWSTMVVRGLQVFQVQRAANVSLFQLRVDRREPAKEVVSRIAWLVILREIQHEARTDGGKPRPFELFCQGKLGGLLLLLLRCD